MVTSPGPQKNQRTEMQPEKSTTTTYNSNNNNNDNNNDIYYINQHY